MSEGVIKLGGKKKSIFMDKVMAKGYQKMPK